MTTVLVERLLDASNDLTSFAVDDKFLVLIARINQRKFVPLAGLFKKVVANRVLDFEFGPARRAVAGFLLSPDAFAVAETRQRSGRCGSSCRSR